MKRLATEVYVYAYPLVLMDVTRQVQTARVPENTFQHRRTLPDATATDAAHPNPDMLASQAWLDLSHEPVVLSVPDTKGRYYVMQMIDAWTDVFQSPGKRTTGTNKGAFAIVGPKWKGELPKDLEEIKAPTEMVWLLGRMQANGRADAAAVTKLQDQFNLAPLSQWRKSGAKGVHAPAAAPAAVDLKTPPVEQVAQMDAQTFFTRFAALLPGNPPAKEDAAVVEKYKKLGVVAGQPFAMGKLDAAGSERCRGRGEGGARRHRPRGKGQHRRPAQRLDHPMGPRPLRHQLRPARRRRLVGPWRAPRPRMRSSPRPISMRGACSLSGANKYVLHFDKGKAPPADGFWSLAMYNDKQLLVPNAIERNAIGDRDKLRFNPDGSLDLYLQNEDPGQGQGSRTGCPRRKENFNLILRVYWPKQEMLQRVWSPPPIKRGV